MKAWRAFLIASILFAGIFVTFEWFSMWITEHAVRLYYALPEITASELETRQEAPDSSLMLFDVRAPEEFDISHLRNAHRIEPGIEPNDFISEFGSKIRGKTLVFYCSAGYRSSAAIKNVSQAAEQHGAKSLVNLRGGIFRWYNQGLAVVNEHGPTDDIHPYSYLWRFMIRKRHRNASPEGNDR